MSRPMSLRDAIVLLELEQQDTITPDVLKKQYRRLALIYHPDQRNKQQSSHHAVPFAPRETGGSDLRTSEEKSEGPSPSSASVPNKPSSPTSVPSSRSFSKKKKGGTTLPKEMSQITEAFQLLSRHLQTHQAREVTEHAAPTPSTARPPRGTSTQPIKTQQKSSHEHWLSFYESLRGGTFAIVGRHKTPCSTCSGMGYLRKSSCRVCKGEGQIRIFKKGSIRTVTCSQCNASPSFVRPPPGSSSRLSNPAFVGGKDASPETRGRCCPTCNGDKESTEVVETSVSFRPGTRDGDRLSFVQAFAHGNEKEEVVLRVRPHSFYGWMDLPFFKHPYIELTVLLSWKDFLSLEYLILPPVREGQEEAPNGFCEEKGNIESPDSSANPKEQPEHIWNVDGFSSSSSSLSPPTHMSSFSTNVTVSLWKDSSLFSETPSSSISAPPNASHPHKTMHGNRNETNKKGQETSARVQGRYPLHGMVHDPFDVCVRLLRPPYRQPTVVLPLFCMEAFDVFLQFRLDPEESHKIVSAFPTSEEGEDLRASVPRFQRLRM
mmetsp:Transcript_40499/g.105025  ORF Transcript_40499/g.105025 Transcript_40499/m.105025 type:complete len:546 (-) Transcript_40499:2570-4207(-)|eukprot:CAMPEP_0113912762 /NCGR_PEP_ID=MMETSP0780_2-20120614/29127_1 /TAXON_ID=652834 /ORGANISM="Palpitomonas bilix" /LENGTH=545 /DNA_ID=CAMNT_0000909797 /DNA_START=495 /DNA_END=2132 /DNA_ORIENTATION=- /assembly_acc=CAM_ASM_000599